ncbi:MAG: hypothetical protein IPN60_00180 [Saprospiraceae bacterium]|nr:hypothetical protein [Candidatus Opimibacter skivensis]
MTDHTVILLCGFYCLGFVLFHSRFWKLFAWRTELDKLSAANKAIMQILNLRLMYVFLFVAAICFLFPNELATTTLGHFFLGGMSLFWLGRTVEQFIFIKVDHPLVHLLTYIFLIGAILFAMPVVL